MFGSPVRPAVCFHAGPLGRRCTQLEGVGAADVVGDDLAVAVHLDAVVDGVAVGRLAGGQQHGGDDAGARRGCHAVGLDQVDAQRVGHEGRRVVLLDDREHVAADQPRGEGELLHGREVIDASGVARPFIVGPQAELALGLRLPCVCGLLRHAERLPVDPALELEPDADHVCAVSADGRGGDGCGHVEHPGSLPECPVVGVDVLLGAAAEGPEALGRPLVPARAGVAVALVHGAGALPAALRSASVLSSADGAHLLRVKMAGAGRKGAKTPGRQPMKKAPFGASFTSHGGRRPRLCGGAAR